VTIERGMFVPPIMRASRDAIAAKREAARAEIVEVRLHRFLLLMQMISVFVA